VQAVSSDPGISENRRGFRLTFPYALLIMILGLIALAAFGLNVVRERSRKAQLLQAKDALTAKRFGVARQRLTALSEHWTGDGEVWELLGSTEQKLGHLDEALACWAKVPSSSPFFARAALAGALQLMERGRYAPAEERLLAALPVASAPERSDIEAALTRLYRYQGRFDDVRRLIRETWCRAPYPVAGLKELWQLDLGPRPVELMKYSLSKADQSDDRVWLGWANHAILTGQLDDAASWLKRCVERRPNDEAVWRTALDLAVARGEVAGFQSAASQLPIDRFDPEEVVQYRVWLARQVGDPVREQHELAELVGHGFPTSRELDRLAALRIQAGKPREAEELRRRKAVVDRNYEEYFRLFSDTQDLAARADELAEHSARLGRTFDAEAWAIVALARRQDPDLLKPTLTPRRISPLPASVVSRATLLSERFASARATAGSVGERLIDRLADIGSVSGEQSGRATGAGPGRRGRAVKKTSIAFVDDAESAGLRFRFDNGASAQHLLPETMSGGVGVIDFDGDGWLDVYCVQGGALAAVPGGASGGSEAAGDRLFRNRRDGTFEDVTESSGISRIAWGQGYGMGVTVGDYDNDRHADLFISRLMTYALYRNRGDGTFEDVTVPSGLAGRRDHPTSAAFADLDNDGDLDLYVCHYMIWDPTNPTICQNEKGETYYCVPTKVAPAPDHVFRNDSGHFVDVTAAAGFAEKQGRGLGVVAADLNGDDRIDLFVANDLSVNYLFQNRGDFRFEETGLQSGVAAGAQGGYQAGMGVACGDLDGDGRPELMVTNFYGEGTTLYRNLGDGFFTDNSMASGIGLATRFLLGFGIAMGDMTNHGRLDVMITNGHVNDNRPFYQYAMPARLYENQPDGRLVDVSDQAGAPWKVERVGRGLAAADLDNDGRVDVLILAQGDPLAYIHNRSEAVGHYVTFSLEGNKSNRDGVGASVTITGSGGRQFAQRCGGGSYQSASDPRLHFGLGASTRVDSVEVRWPSGRVDRWNDIAADAGYLLREGERAPLPLPGFARH
jgi:tetratricopeptide (TPR) repeat protein